MNSLPNPSRDSILSANVIDVTPRRKPLAVVVDSLQAARSVHPGGVAVVFSLAYLAGVVGSIAAPLVVAALLFGLFVARQSNSAPYRGEGLRVVDSGDFAPVASPLDSFAAAGLEVNSVTFKKPAASRAKKNA